MASIKTLPEAVHSSVRSSIILFDLTRVVEELIYNSLDAGATKVSIFIGVGTCYVKVVDDGSGITRDGLQLTSKLHPLANMDAAKGSFGFRGEALGSISDVSLLEIVTKAHGKPNGYRKGCKCLYLGIDDDRQDVGTTVVVRDLFYNQPVRRKHMQSSPKKVLHSVKKCVLLIALVHSKVSFKVVDIESEDELLYTRSSSSPLSLLISGFGIEISSSLHELNLSNGILKLSGYLSGPYDTFSMKALQYVYINSRFVGKGPIHKLLNQLAIRFKCLDPLKVNNRVQEGKRSRSQAYPSYILKLSCPRSHYDLTFEPSKTSVEFKDWVPILTFIEKAITQFWSEKMASGKSCSHTSDIIGKDEMWEEGDNIISAEEDSFVADFLKKSETAEKVCRIQNQQASVGLPTFPLEMLTGEISHVPDKKDDRISLQNLYKNTAEFGKQHTDMGFFHQTKNSFKSWDGSLTKHISSANRESDNHLWALDNDFFSVEDNFLENNFIATERSDDYVDFSFGSSWENESLKVDPNVSRSSGRSSGSALSYDCFEFGKNAEEVSEDLKKPFLQSCSRENLLPDGEMFARDETFEHQIDGFRTKRKRLDPDDQVDVVEVDGSNQSVDFFPRTLWQDEAASGCPSLRLRKKCDMHTDLGFPSRDSIKLFSPDRERFSEEDDFPPDSIGEFGNFGSAHFSLHSEWQPVTSDPFVKSMHWDVEQFTHENALDVSLQSDKHASSEDFAKRGGNSCIFRYDSMPNSLSQGNCSSSSCANNELDFKGYAGPKREICKFLQGQNLDIISPKHSDILTDETDWFCVDSCGKDNADNFAVSSHFISSFSYIDKDENQRDLLRQRDSGQNHVHRERSIRSHSAPPFYRGKKFFALSDHLTRKARKPNTQAVHEALTFPETGELKHLQQSSGAFHLYLKPTFVEDSVLEVRPEMKRKPDIAPEKNEIKRSESLRSLSLSTCLILVRLKTSLLRRLKIQQILGSNVGRSVHRLQFSTLAIFEYFLKYRCIFNLLYKFTNGDESHHFHDQCNILDISSGILHLAGDSLVPESINKNCLENAKVLQQVDKKFIPVVASGTLAIIDQHAADERIRLEELRQKVLIGEMKAITYLDAEQELVLPEIGYQLLHNYAEQIQNWGWICNIHSQGSKSFTKNLNLLHRRPAVVTLLAVPCVLGVNLSDVDLLEFLQQLADTDGSSTMPPSVLRVLNSKACRGAIMFGDTLLPSECSLIVEELKQTSLCFQCAHGRPTTVPLVNLEALHKQIAKLGLLNDGSNQSWHGLRRHERSLERAAQRLNLAS
ncbi:hypothetical protein L1049_023432 [Liquidambar formosana]|uniref:DNA mismatch repair protein MLH3 n=1 Tax=Liquidambar formosana TaxID=63359 RepID=A0AAP0RTG7_LIQFO